ncbi:hypothetical protein Q8A73_008098 [Channa argus]|nr:hypothetical protein Q8A73_008098 [Channa argus]
MFNILRMSVLDLIKLLTLGFIPILTSKGANETTSIDPENQIYWVISVPVSIVAIVIVGIFCFVKHKRTESFTREESGYYANFSRASSNQAKSEATSIKNENTQLPQQKTIDEPVYVNTEDATGQTEESMDLTENIYVNIVYSK